MLGVQVLPPELDTQGEEGMLTIGLAVVGTVVGGVIGAWVGDREGGDFNIAPAIYAPIGGLIGCFAGMIVGQVVSR